MKLTIHLILFLTLVSCTSSLKREDAIVTTEHLINDIKEEKYTNLSNYYTKDFFQTTTISQWVGDLKKVNELSGPIQSYTIIGSDAHYSIGDQSYILLTYEITHTKSVSRQVFTVIIEEGKCKIYGHKIKYETD